ncbi:hypothetical protein ECV0102_18930 [Enterobacter cloacae]|nr:hypothetical protein ECV0102_18930 [Enterobacter cloacae]
MPGIDESLKDFPLNPETQITLRSRHHHAGKGVSSIVRKLDGGGSDKRWLSARIVTRGIIAARHEDKRQKANGKAGCIEPEHGKPL